MAVDVFEKFTKTSMMNAKGARPCTRIKNLNRGDDGSKTAIRFFLDKPLNDIFKVALRYLRSKGTRAEFVSSQGLKT